MVKSQNGNGHCCRPHESGLHNILLTLYNKIIMNTILFKSSTKILIDTQQHFKDKGLRRRRRMSRPSPYPPTPSSTLSPCLRTNASGSGVTPRFLATLPPSLSKRASPQFLAPSFPSAPRCARASESPPPYIWQRRRKRSEKDEGAARILRC